MARPVNELLQLEVELTKDPAMQVGVVLMNPYEVLTS